MPRIAATLGVFGLVVLALGLNIAQFPIEYGAVSPPEVAEEPEETVLPGESKQSPPVVLKLAAERPVQSPRESERAEVTTPEDRADSRDKASTNPRPPNSDAKTGPSSKRSEEERVPADLPGDSDAAQAPMEQNRPPVAGGIYNPLEPEPASAVDSDSVARAMPNDPPVPAAPAAALAGPPYGAASPANVTAERTMVPIERNTEDDPQEPGSSEQVLRLPSVDSVWPGVATDQPPEHGWIPSESYPTTKPPE